MIASLLFPSPPYYCYSYFYFLQNRSKTELRGSDTFLHEDTKLPTESHCQRKPAAGQSCSWASLFHTSFQSREAWGAHVGRSSPAPGGEEKPSAFAQGGGRSKQLRLHKDREEEGVPPVGRGPGDAGRGHPGRGPGLSGHRADWGGRRL